MKFFAYFASKITKSDYKGFYFKSHQSLSHILDANIYIASVFLRNSKLKFCLGSSIVGAFGAKM